MFGDKLSIPRNDAVGGPRTYFGYVSSESLGSTALLWSSFVVVGRSGDGSVLIVEVVKDSPVTSVSSSTRT